MEVKTILKREAVKIFSEWCLDRGFTVDELINDPNRRLVRNKMVKILYDKGFTQELLAELIKRTPRTVRDILKESK